MSPPEIRIAYGLLWIRKGHRGNFVAIGGAEDTEDGLSILEVTGHDTATEVADHLKVTRKEILRRLRKGEVVSFEIPPHWSGQRIP